jgi:hypothetical protein
VAGRTRPMPSEPAPRGWQIIAGLSVTGRRFRSLAVADTHMAVSNQELRSASELRLVSFFSKRRSPVRDFGSRGLALARAEWPIDTSSSGYGSVLFRSQMWILECPA